MSLPTFQKKTLFRNLLILSGVIFVFFLLMKIGDLKEALTPALPTATQGTRKFDLYVPDSYDPNFPTPLVITLHGYSALPSQIAQVSHWNDLADEDGFIVLYPQGSGSPTQWLTSGLPENGLPADADVTFISGLIDTLESEYNIDPTRIYVNGHSMGGGMSHVLACALADRVAAVGSVAGAFSYPEELCNPSRPVPFIAFHGTQDMTVAYDNKMTSAYGPAYPSIPSFMEDWSKRNHCAGSAELPLEGDVSITRYTRCDQNAEVILYSIVGGGHTWPGDTSDLYESLGYTTQQIDATRLMWQFFKEHPLQPDGLE